MEQSTAIRRFQEGRVGRLATIGPKGPHVVPIVFALEGEQIITAVDHKPKSTRRLRRIDNIKTEPRVSIVVDEYHEDWSRLWWVRADGIAYVLEEPEAALLDTLVAKYSQYENARPEGPFVHIAVDRWRWWESR
ncbi:MAG: TIGR03668 family PPOX class F420-dependent oxidoreductase [Acidimicrobiia bacterium]|nr:TIGR03668 family PPOX class F420-dependent oxidoreductase [Acidimicrobiia bacterium]